MNNMFESLFRKKRNDHKSILLLALEILHFVQDDKELPRA